MDTLDMVITALCADYFRRDEEIRARRLPPRILMEYSYINNRIYEAAASVSIQRADTYIREIGERTGYTKSALADMMCERMYKEEKKRVRDGIKVRLHLWAPVREGAGEK